MKKQPPLEIVIGEDQALIDALNDSVEVGQVILQTVIDEFIKVPFYDPDADLPSIIQNHEFFRKSYIRQLVLDMHSVPEGSVLELNIDREAERYKISTPSLDQAIVEVNQFGVTLSHFQFTNGKVTVNEEAVQRATDRYRTVIKSKQGLRFLELSQKIMVELKELDSLARPTGTILLNRLHPLQLDRFWKEAEDGYAVHPQFMRRIEKYWARIEEEEKAAVK